MKKLLLKSVIQFFVSSILLALAYYFWIGRGSMGTIIVQILLKVPLAVIAGILIGDLDLYKGDKFSLLAVVVSTVLCLGVIIGLLFISDFFKVLNIRVVKIVVVLAIVELPPIMGYNLVSAHSRKACSKP